MKAILYLNPPPLQKTAKRLSTAGLKQRFLDEYRSNCSNVTAGRSRTVAKELYSRKLRELATSAANMTVSGRVTEATGRGVNKATVVISNASGVVQTAKTNGFEYYFFEGIQFCESYLVNVESKHYNFTSWMVNVNDEVVNLDFVANP